MTARLLTLALHLIFCPNADRPVRNPLAAGHLFADTTYCVEPNFSARECLSRGEAFRAGGYFGKGPCLIWAKGKVSHDTLYVRKLWWTRAEPDPDFYGRERFVAQDVTWWLCGYRQGVGCR